MVVRTKTLFSCFVVAVALTAAGCGFNQPSRFRTAFLPPASHPGGQAIELAEPPVVQPNPYLADVPPFLLTNPQVAERRIRADALVQRADRAFQAGKRYCQSNDIENARREFDAAIDLMLDASDQNPADREEYERKLDEMVDAIHRLDLAGLGASAGVEEGRFEQAPLEDILQMTFPVDPKLKDKVREQVAATVSQLPLSVNDAVLGYIHYFSGRGHKTLVAGLRRSGLYRPMIQRILDEEGLPQELIHLAQAESGFIPRAVSRKAAGGMWQFLKWRGNEYGLAQTRYTDDRMDPEKATRAAAHHLRDLYQEFGDWYLAMAAYNCGPVVVERAVERTGYADFWEIRSRGVLPAQTANYVPVILAMIIMEKNASEYGLEGIQLEPPLESDVVEVSAPTSLALVSDLTETPLAELAALNPAILKGMAPEGYAVRVPKGGGSQLTAALPLIPAEHRNSWRVHRVGAGETLAAIGKRYATAPSSIVAANRLSSAQAAEGNRLLIPAALRVETPVRRTASRTAARRRAPVHRASAKVPAAKPAAPAQPVHNSPPVLTRTASR
ncbi:MAG: transglycosylase SLT domain-containing protein [Bryobacteraceae bacterium]|jgi:membrane-bound lytic murein transglycosylase D